MSFTGDLQAFARKVEQRSKDVFVTCTTEVQRSVVEGSSLTAAPGQPVDTGTLKGSYIPEFTGQWTWRTTTGVAYAEAVEAGIVNPHSRGPYTRLDGTQVRKHSVRGYKMHFHNGGPHSVALTRNGWERIVNDVTKRVVGE